MQIHRYDTDLYQKMHKHSSVPVHLPSVDLRLCCRLSTASTLVQCCVLKVKLHFKLKLRLHYQCQVRHMYMYQNTGAVSHNNNVNQSMYTLHSTIKARQCKTELQALANDEGHKNEGRNKIPLVCT